MKGNSVLLLLLILIAFANFSWEFCEHDSQYYQRLNCYSFEWSELSTDTNLHQIYIKNSYIYDIKPAAFRYNIYLNELSMPGNNITILEPGSFSGLTNLQVLNLARNNIQVISKGLFSGMYNLVSLDLSKNSIDTIENASFVGTDRLQSLYLHDNKLINMPPIRDHCVNLITIDLCNNQIQEFGADKLTSSLIYLNVSGNELKSISAEDFLNLPKLEELSLSRNNLFKNNFPIGLFQNLKQLKMLNLSSTAIRKINIGSFSGLQRLKILDLSSNNVTSLPSGLFHDLESLKQLDISNNRLFYFKYDGPSKLNEIGLNKNLWNCDSLSVMLHKLRGISIKHGDTFNTTNLFGIECIDEARDTISVNSDNSSQLSIETQIFSQIMKIQVYNENALTKLTDILQLLRNDASAIAMIEKENQRTLTDIKNSLSSKGDMEKSTASLLATHSQVIQPYKTSTSTNGGGTTALYGIFIVLLAILIVILFTLYKRNKHVSHNYDEGNPLHSLRV